jgi:hypothetical protein
MALLMLAACGSDDEGNGAEADAPPPPAQPEDFPDPRGKTLIQLHQELADKGGPILSPSASDFEPGKNRFGFGLFDRTRAQIADAPAAVYVAQAGGGRALGPFPARYESLEVQAQFQSAGVREDPDSAQLVYVADVEFPQPGTYDVMGIVRLDDRLVAATPSGAIQVQRDSPVPEVGERAPRVSTPTLADVGGDVEQIDTRTPPSTMHEQDFADVVGKRPAVLLFATPALCQSRVCGPVVDIAEQVKSERGDDAAWIHMEIFNDNEVAKGYRPQVRAWKLPSEPWLFTVDAKGRVAARIEGAFSAEELEAAVEAALKG